MLDFDLQIKIDKLFENKFHKSGGIDYTDVPQLRRGLNFLFEDEESDYVKEDIVDYLEDFLPEFQLRIERQKKIIKELEENSFKEGNKFILKVMKLQSDELKKWIIEKRMGLEKNQINETSDLDLIDIKNIKGTEKIIYLKKLGVLDFLKEKIPFNMSVNSLAKVVGAITGEKVTTVQSYLNPIYSNTFYDKNNPLNNEKAVEKIKQKLISIGFNPVD